MIKVGVIRGGVSSRYGSSIESGGHILSHLRDSDLKDKYQAIDLFVDKDGILHHKGVPINIDKLHNIVDVVFNALHGYFGEDGKLQQTLEHWKIPYTGSGIFTSAMCHNRSITKDHFKNVEVKTPPHMLFPVYQEDFDGEADDYALSCAQRVWRKMPAPWIVKPISVESSMAIHVCKTFDDLTRAFRESVEKRVGLIVEELIIGKEAHVFTIDKFRNKDLYTLPPVEIHSASGDAIHPGKFTSEEKSKLENLAKMLHKEFGLEHYSSSKFIVHPKKGIYALGVRTLPDLHEDSMLHKSLHSVGSSMPEFIGHILKLALHK